MLMPSILPPIKDQHPGSFKCERKKCIICEKHVTEGQSFQSCQTQEQFQLRDNFTCDTRNIIYLISCTKCHGAEYVGQTQNSLRERFYLHRSHIGKNKGTPLTMHFNKHGHSLEDMKCMAIEKVLGESQEQRLRRESFWITKLKTLIPHGLNTDQQNEKHLLHTLSPKEHIPSTSTIQAPQTSKYQFLKRSRGVWTLGN